MTQSLPTAAAMQQNLRFLIMEVGKQVERTRRYAAEPSQKLLDSVLSSDDYIDNLKNILQRHCFSEAARATSEGKAAVDFLRALNVITVNLERIADFCEDIITQLGYLRNRQVLDEIDFVPFFNEVSAAVARIEEAVFERDIQVSLEICKAENELDRLYAAEFERIITRLERAENAQGWVTMLFISHYFERMGDALLNIGEAVISAYLGERIKIDEFWALEESLEDVAPERGAAQVSLQAMGETRSGCRIDRVSFRGDTGGRSVIFKEGRAGKLRAERDSIEKWQQVMPGLAPKIHSFHDNGENASILFEFLQGTTFEHLLLQEDGGDVAGALTSLCRTLETVWKRTMRKEPASAGFARQLAGRLGDVYSVHPAYRRSVGIGRLTVPSLDRLADAAAALEDDGTLVAPFSVFIHGDCNVDNIIVSGPEQGIHFIDLHRSRQTDYLQDVSVFAVSNYRLQVFDAPIRRRIGEVTERFHAFAASFARAHGDETFEARLALALARSFATSTRFVLEEDFAKAMLLRAHYLLEKLLAHPRTRMESFHLPTEVLFD